MALSNFFRINLPYGIKKNANNEWMAFNREYMPLGWNTTDFKMNIQNDEHYSDKPIYTGYKALTDKKLLEIAGSEKNVRYGEDKKINMIYLYDDKTNPSSSPEYWKYYLDKIMKLSVLIRK